MDKRIEQVKNKAVEIYNIPIRWPFALVALILWLVLMYLLFPYMRIR